VDVQVQLTDIVFLEELFEFLDLDAATAVLVDLFEDEVEVDGVLGLLAVGDGGDELVLVDVAVLVDVQQFEHVVHFVLGQGVVQVLDAVPELQLVQL